MKCFVEELTTVYAILHALLQHFKEFETNLLEIISFPRVLWRDYKNSNVNESNFLKDKQIY